MPVSFTLATSGSPTSSVGKVLDSTATDVEFGVVVDAELVFGAQATATTSINSSIGRPRQRLKYDTSAPLPKGCDFNYSQTPFFAHKGGVGGSFYIRWASFRSGKSPLKHKPPACAG